MTGAPRNFLLLDDFSCLEYTTFSIFFDNFFAYHRFPSNYALPSPVVPRGCRPFLTFELIRINAIINLTFLRNNIIFHLILLVPLQFIKIQNLKYATFYARKLHVPTCKPSYFHMDPKCHLLLSNSLLTGVWVSPVIPLLSFTGAAHLPHKMSLVPPCIYCSPRLLSTAALAVLLAGDVPDGVLHHSPETLGAWDGLRIVFHRETLEIFNF
jgi:hypothetical protein